MRPAHLIDSSVSRTSRQELSARKNQLDEIRVQLSLCLFCPAPTARSRAKLGTLLRLDLTDEKYLARALSLSQSLPVSAKKR
jgi:hypothetical protein